jgi:hypothetical protein
MIVGENKTIVGEKKIGGPLKPFFGLSGVHLQVPANHLRQSEPGFSGFAKSTTAT